MKQRVWTRLSPDEIETIDGIATQLHSTRSSVLCLAVERYLSKASAQSLSTAEGDVIWTRLPSADIVKLDAQAPLLSCTRVDLIAHAAKQLIIDFRK